MFIVFFNGIIELGIRVTFNLLLYVTKPILKAFLLLFKALHKLPTRGELSRGSRDEQSR